MPPTYILLVWGLKALWGLLIFAYGACIGSLINVIVYRLPLGQSIVTPPSRCPKCQTKLSWRDNIPVLGWLMLRGKCRYCGVKISAEYPIVEAFVGGLFVMFYVLFYAIPTFGKTMFLGIDWGAIKPEWYYNDPVLTWPTFVVLLILMACMVAMTIIDARTFTIPSLLTTVPVVVAIVAHPIHAAFIGNRHMMAAPAPFCWGMATVSRIRWDWMWAAIGGCIGLGVGVLLVRFKLLPQSFADYAEWEESVQKQPVEPVATADAAANDQPAPAADAPAAPPAPVASPEAPADLWIQYPHARREMIKEVLFLAPCLGLAMAGFYFGRWYYHMSYNDFAMIWTAPLTAQRWFVVLTGVMLGYLVGGGIVWAVRILGSLAFGKEAMGLGDVHLMAAVGACLGWIDSGLAVMGAAFVGLFRVLLGTAFSGAFKVTVPYGPYLAVSTLLVILCKPLIETGLSRLTHEIINIP